jgi:hypothetical protein
MRVAICNNNNVVNLQDNLYLFSCESKGCDTAIIVSDVDINLKHPNCICDSEYALCLTHIQNDFTCKKCKCPCAAYDCFQPSLYGVECVEPLCKKLLCTECSDMGRIHCENHRERGG